MEEICRRERQEGKNKCEMHILIFVTVLPLANDMTHNLEGVDDEIEIEESGEMRCKLEG